MSLPAKREILTPSLGSEVLRTSDCLAKAEQLFQVENHYFGADFAWTREQMESCLRSGCLFYSAIADQGQIVALASMLLTSQRSIDDLICGKITEQQMAPWFLESNGKAPAFYFASVISDSTAHLIGLYGSLLLDICGYLAKRGLRVPAGYSIAFGPEGERHLQRNGFERMQVEPYLQKYAIMTISAFTARTEFWKCILNSPEPEVDSAKAVEARLQASKAERYRHLYQSHD